MINLVKNILYKTIIIILAFISVFLINVQSVYASSRTDFVDGADEFINTGVNASKGNSTVIDEKDLVQMSDMLYNAFLIIGIIIAVIFGLVIAIKFVTGSVEEKADVKKTLVPYIAGCIVIFGAFTIWKLVVDLLGNA